MTTTTATTTNDKVNANSGPGPVIKIVGQAARAGKYKLGARVGKYKLRARAGKHRLGSRAGGRDRARGLELRPGASQRASSREIQTPFLYAFFLLMNILYLIYLNILLESRRMK